MHQCTESDEKRDGEIETDTAHVHMHSTTTYIITARTAFKQSTQTQGIRYNMKGYVESHSHRVTVDVSRYSR